MTKLEDFDLEWTECYIDRLIEESCVYQYDNYLEFLREVAKLYKIPLR